MLSLNADRWMDGWFWRAEGPPDGMDWTSPLPALYNLLEAGRGPGADGPVCTRRSIDCTTVSEAHVHWWYI